MITTTTLHCQHLTTPALHMQTVPLLAKYATNLLVVLAGPLAQPSPSKTDVVSQPEKMLNSPPKTQHHAADRSRAVSLWDAMVDSHQQHCNGWQALVSLLAGTTLTLVLAVHADLTP